MKILIAEDDVTSQVMLEVIVAKTGNEPIITGDGLSAYEILGRPDAPKIAILDWMMPGMDGVEVCRRIREIKTDEPAYIIILTSRDKAQDIIDGLKAGANDYIVKPYNTEELQVRIGVGCQIVELQANLVGQINELERSKEVLRRSEEKLQESEARYRHITEGLTDYQYVVRIENGRAVETTHNQASLAVTGYTPEEFAADPNLWIRMVAPEDRERVRQCVHQILAGQETSPIEHRIVCKDGTVRWVSDTAILNKDARGKLLSYYGVIKDISERKRMEEEILTVSTLEKEGMARELHDGLAQQFAGTAYLCHVLKDQLTAAPHKKAMSEIETELHQCLEHIRHIANGLLPVGLEDEGLMAALQHLVEMISKMFPVNCRVEQFGDPIVFDLKTSTHLYYLIQEAVRNAARHGNPRNIVISISYNLEQLTIQDDGSGFDLSQPGKGGMGLQIMRYRADIIGGVLAIDSHKGGGTCIRCRLPVLSAPAGRDTIASVRKSKNPIREGANHG